MKYFKKFGYILWWGIRQPLKPFVIIEKNASGDLFKAVHWTTEWLMKQDWILDKINGSDTEWEDVLQEHYDKIKKAMNDFKRNK